MSGYTDLDAVQPTVPASLARRLWTSSISVSAATIALRAGGFLGNVIAIRLLAPERMGQLGVIEGWVSAATAIALSGLGSAVTRQVAAALGSSVQEAGELSTAAVIITSVLGAIMSLAGYAILSTVAIDANDPTLQTLSYYALAVAAFLFVSMLRQIAAALAYALQAYRSLLVASVIVGVLSPPLSWVLVAWYGLSGALSLRVLLLVVEASVLGYAVARELHKRGAIPSTSRLFSRTRQLVTFGLPLSLGDIITVPVQPLMLSILARQTDGLTQVGMLTAVGRLSSISSFLPGSLAATVTPLLSGEWGRGDRQGFAAGTLLSIRALWFTTLPIVTFFLVASPFLLKELFGENYAAAWPIAVVTLITTLLVSLNQTADRAFVSAGRVWLSSSNNLVLIVLFAALGLTLIPQFLAIGYAAALLIAYLMYLLWQFNWLRRLWQVPVADLRIETVASVLILIVSVALAATVEGIPQLAAAFAVTGLALILEARYFLKPAERNSLKRYLSGIVRRRVEA